MFVVNAVEADVVEVGGIYACTGQVDTCCGRGSGKDLFPPCFCTAVQSCDHTVYREAGCALVPIAQAVYSGIDHCDCLRQGTCYFGLVVFHRGGAYHYKSLI